MSTQSNRSETSQPSRRDFIKTSTTAALAAGLAGNLSLSRSAHAAGSDTIRIGLVGCGGRGTGAADNALSTQGSVQLVAMGDAFPDRLQSSLKNLQKKHTSADRINVPTDRQFVGFDAAQKVIDSDVDLVILATPPGFRPYHLKAAIDAGKHVFAEKPVAVDAPGVRMVLETAKKAKEKKLALAVGLHRRHMNVYKETIQRLQDGAIGDLLASRAYWTSAGVWVRPRETGWTDMEYQMRNWYYFNWLCGDHIVEQHIHNLDVINWLKDAYPVKAQGVGGRQVRTDEEFGEIFDHFGVEYEYADGSRMFSYCRHIGSCWNSVSEHVQGSKGSAYISRGEINVNGSEPWRFRGAKDDGFQTEHDDLFAKIRAGEAPNEGEYGALSSMTSILGRMVAYSGKEITWDKALASNLTQMPAKLAWDAAPPVPKVAMPGFTQVV